MVSSKPDAFNFKFINKAIIFNKTHKTHFTCRVQDNLPIRQQNSGIFKLSSLSRRFMYLNILYGLLRNSIKLNY